MSDNGSENDGHYGEKENMGDTNDMDMNLIIINNDTQLPPTLGRAVLCVTRTMLQLLQMR